MTNPSTGFKAFSNKANAPLANAVQANESTKPDQTPPTTPPTEKPAETETKPK